MDWPEVLAAPPQAERAKPPEAPVEAGEHLGPRQGAEDVLHDAHGEDDDSEYAEKAEDDVFSETGHLLGR